LTLAAERAAPRAAWPHALKSPGFALSSHIAYKLDQVEEAYNLFGHQRDGVLKVAITP
jgi:threonine dehydrogenase-like Zn-dependent dehydrogenase